MKVFSFPRVAIALAVATAATISGCGTSNNGLVAGGFGAPGMPGYNGYASGGCVPINSPIGFTGSGIPMSSTYWNAGLLPGYGQAFGSVVVGGAVAAQPIYGGVGQLQGAGISGSINVSLQSNGYAQPYPTTGYPTTGYPTTAYPTTYPYNGGMATISGTVSISPIEQQSIMYEAQQGQYGGYNPYVTGYPTTGYPTTTYPGTVPMPGLPTNGMICVSGIAIGNAHIYSSVLPNLAADVYLYMNNTQHGHVLRFY